MNISVILLCALALVSQNTAFPTDDGSLLTYANLKDQFFQFLVQLSLKTPANGAGDLPGASELHPAGNPLNPTGLGAPKDPGVPKALEVPGLSAVTGSPDSSTNPLNSASQIATYKDSLFKSMADCHYNEAINFLKTIISLDKGGKFLTDLFNQLLGTKCDILTFAYSLWSNGSQDIVTEHFPKDVQDILEGKSVCIKNVAYNQYLSYKNGGDKKIRAVVDKNADQCSFKLIPSGLSNNTAVFKFFNDKLKVYINLDPKADNIRDHQLLVTEDANDESSKFTLEPWQTNASEQQYIFNSVLYSQPVKLGLGTKSDGSRFAYTNGVEKPKKSKKDARFHFTFQTV